MKGNFRRLQREQTLSLENVVHACVQSPDGKYQEILYKRFYGYLLAIALRYAKSREDAEELVNETFVKAFAKLHVFSVKSEATQYEKLFKGWLAKICVNLSIDFLRSKKSMLHLDDQPEFDQSESPIDASGNLLVQDLMGLLMKLPLIQRTIFNLYELEGYSHEEISKLLEIPESTSRTYLTRAKQKLRALYDSSERLAERLV